MLRVSAASELEMLDETQRANVVATLEQLARKGELAESERICGGGACRVRLHDCVLVYSSDSARSRIVVASVRRRVKP